MDEFTLQPAQDNRAKDFGTWDVTVTETAPTPIHAPTQATSEAFYAQQGRTQTKDFAEWTAPLGDNVSTSTTPGTAPVFMETPRAPTPPAPPPPEKMPWYYPVIGLAVAYYILKRLTK